MANPRRGNIDRSNIDDDDSAPPSLAQVDAALYGKLARVDGGRRAAERTRFGAFKITPKGLEIGEGAQEKDWREAGEFIFQVDSGIQWLMGDWLLYGLDLRYGDIPKIADEFGRDEKTLHHYKQICEKFEFTRRRVDLSFGHHDAVRALRPEEQDQALAYAAEHNLSVAAFRKELRGAQTTPALPNGEQLNIGSVSRDMEKFWLRDPSTAKPQDHEKAYQIAFDAQMAVDAFKRKWGIE